MVEALTDLQTCPLNRVWHPGHYGAPATSENPGIRLERTTPDIFIQLSLFAGQEKKAMAAVKKAGIKQLPETGQSALRDDLSVYALGSGRYLIESSSPTLQADLKKAIPADIGSVTDLSSARTVLTATSADMEKVLSKGIAIDFHRQAFPAGTVAETNIHQMPVMIVRLADNQFRIFTYSTYAVSTLHWLETACHDHGFERV
jgi:sarcosine oxidase subunit gamma